MNATDFYQLSRPVQDGLLDAFRGQFTPAPILTRRGAGPAALAWVAVGSAAALVLLVLSRAGFGDVESSLSLYPTPVMAAYALLAGLSALGVIQALACRARLRSLPFDPGLFLFPANLIDARDRMLRVYPLAELSSVAAGPGGAVVVRFGARSFSFPVADASRVPEVVGLVEAARDRMREGPDAEERRRLDPLEPPVVVSPLAPTTPLSRSAPPWERQAWLLAAVIGTVSGVGLFFLRNLTSDERMFGSSRARDDVATYKGYAARGRRHVEEVRQVLLPRAELRAAVAQGSVDAIDAFARAYPATGIQAEVDAARKTALVAELERARKLGTLAALVSFVERHPDHGLDKSLEQARHEIYARALARYKSEMPKGGEGQPELVERLLSYAERAGPKTTPQGLRGPAVQIRFQWRPSQDLEREEVLVRKSSLFGGVTNLPSHHVTAAALESYERSAGQALVDGLARGFDPEVVAFELGPRIEASAEGPLVVASPTLAVSYHVESSGAVQGRSKPRGIFLGLAFFFKVDFLMPGDNKPPSVKYKLAERIPRDILQHDDGSSPPGAVEASIYQAMMRGAFDELPQKYLARWFRPQGDGAPQPEP